MSDADIPYVVNPEAVGDPDETPVVAIPDDVASLLLGEFGCECGGLNGYHFEECDGGV